MLQKVLKFANYAVAVLVKNIMLFCSNYAKNYASTIRQGPSENQGLHSRVDKFWKNKNEVQGLSKPYEPCLKGTQCSQNAFNCSI